ncbi:MAG: ABC transporter ATP-binding protein [Hyphomicrobium sp.]|nr:ABC transporter ATP-binding protein [Hyphomicrobium sp.]
MTPLVSIERVSRRFGSVVALDDVSLEIRENEFFALLGPSGCGKTTLLRILAGFETVDSGAVTLGGADLLPIPPYRRPINLMFQSYALFPHLSVERNVAYGLEREGRPRDEIRARVADVLATVGITETARRRPSQLSGGQRQRVNIARALCVAPNILIADEIVSGLDVSVQAQLLNLLMQLRRRRGFSMLFISHDLSVVRYLCDRMLVMYRGEVVESGPTDRIFAAPSHPYTRTLLAAVPPDDPSAVWSPQPLESDVVTPANMLQEANV